MNNSSCGQKQKRRITGVGLMPGEMDNRARCLASNFCTVNDNFTFGNRPQRKAVAVCSYAPRQRTREKLNQN